MAAGLPAALPQIAQLAGIDFGAAGMAGLKPEDALQLFDAINAMNAKKKADEKVAMAFMKNPVGAATSQAPTPAAPPSLGRLGGFKLSL